MYKKEVNGIFIDHGLGTCIYKEAEKSWVIELISGKYSPFRIITPSHRFYGTRITGIKTLREAKALDLFWSIYDMKKCRRKGACVDLGTLDYEYFMGKEPVEVEEVDTTAWLPGFEFLGE